MGKNILGTSEFLAGVGALAQGVLIGQPNAKSSAAWAAAQAVKKQASVRAAQEALEKERKEKEKKEKGKLGGKIGATVAGLAAAPFTAGMSIPAMMAVSGAATAAGSGLGSAIGGDFDAKTAVTDGAISGLTAGVTHGVGEKMMKSASYDATTAPFRNDVINKAGRVVHKPMKYRMGQALSSLGGGTGLPSNNGYSLKRKKNGAFDYVPKEHPRLVNKPPYENFDFWSSGR